MDRVLDLVVNYMYNGPMNTRIKITPEMGRVIKRRVRDGVEYEEIAREVGVCKRSIANYIEREVIRSYMKATGKVV